MTFQIAHQQLFVPHLRGEVVAIDVNGHHDQSRREDDQAEGQAADAAYRGLLGPERQDQLILRRERKTGSFLTAGNKKTKKNQKQVVNTY